MFVEKARARGVLLLSVMTAVIQDVYTVAPCASDWKIIWGR